MLRQLISVRQISLLVHEMNRVECVEHAWERENGKMCRKSLETSPRASEAKTLATHGRTCVEIAIGNPQRVKNKIQSVGGTRRATAKQNCETTTMILCELILAISQVKLVDSRLPMRTGYFVPMHALK